jgi:hypothetical protein
MSLLLAVKAEPVRKSVSLSKSVRRAGRRVFGRVAGATVLMAAGTAEAAGAGVEAVFGVARSLREFLSFRRGPYAGNSLRARRGCRSLAYRLRRPAVHN